MPSTEVRFTTDKPAETAVRKCFWTFCGRIGFAPALELQMQVSEGLKQGAREDALLLVEHPPTITQGRNGRWDNLLVGRDELRARGVECFEADRGGDITFHGPGQLVGYPLLNLAAAGERDVHKYVWRLEEVLIRLLGEYEIEAFRVAGLTGVWTDKGKIAALGVHLSRWVTRHGFALNVNTDLSCFAWIVPCGIQGRGVTSMQALTSRSYQLAEVGRKAAAQFSAVFHRPLEYMQSGQLRGVFRAAHT